MRAHRKFTDEFKRAAVERLANNSVAEVAEACGVSVSVLHRWRKQLGEHNGTVLASSRRQFSKDFKESAVRRLELGETVGQVAGAYQLDPTVLRRWWHEWRRFSETAFSGYGKPRSPSESSRIVILRFTEDEYEGIQAASLASHASSLPDFVRAQIVSVTPAPTVAEIAQRLDVLLAKLRRVAENLPQARATAGRSNIRENTTPVKMTTMQPTTLYQRYEMSVKR